MNALSKPLTGGTIALVVAITGCTGTEQQLRPREPAPGPPPAELVDLGGPLLEKCRSIRFVSAVCPELVPRADRKYVGRAINFGDPRYRTWDLGASAPYEGRPRRNRPPRFAHVVIQAGDLADAYEFDWPPPPADREPAELLLFARRETPALLEEPTWGGRAGMLVLMPPFELGGIHGDHLVFRWRNGGIDYVFSLHAWAPFSEARSTLRAMVEGLSG